MTNLYSVQEHYPIADTRPGLDFWTSKSTFSTYFLQQWHTYSTKTTPPNPSPAVPLSDKHTFKYMSLCCSTMMVHIDVSGLCCHLRPCWILWSVLVPRAMSGSVALLQLGAMVMSMTCVTSKGHGLCFCLKPCYCLWVVTEGFSPVPESPLWGLTLITNCLVHWLRLIISQLL